jgi:hypothetical protein
LKEEVEVIYCRDPTVNYCSRLWVAIICSILPFGGIKSGMMPLAANHNSQLGAIRLLWLIEGTESFHYFWKLFQPDDIELPLNLA